MEFEVLAKAIANVLGTDPNEITPETTFVKDLGADSLDIYEIIMAVEEKLQIEVNLDEIVKIETVGEAVELIKKTV